MRIQTVKSVLQYTCMFLFPERGVGWGGELGMKLCRLALLSVLKSKMSIVRDIAIPYRILSQKK